MLEPANRSSHLFPNMSPELTRDVYMLACLEAIKIVLF